MTRPLTEQQERRLFIAARYGVTRQVERSVPSLVRRGLMEPCWEKSGGRRFRSWRVTDAGRAELARIKDRDKGDRC